MAGTDTRHAPSTPASLVGLAVFVVAVTATALVGALANTGMSFVYFWGLKN